MTNSCLDRDRNLCSAGSIQGSGDRGRMLDKSEKSLSGSESLSVKRRLDWGFLFGSPRISSRSGDEARLLGRGGRSSGNSGSCLEWIMG